MMFECDIIQKYKNTWIVVWQRIQACATCILNLLGVYKCLCLREKFPYGGSVAEDDHQSSMPIDNIDMNYVYE